MDRKGRGFVFGIILFFLLVSFSLYFVLASESNTKIYDSVMSTATIKNGVTDIAKIKLNTPIVYNVIRGKDRLVAEFTIENYADASDIFKDMEFYDLKNSNTRINREFVYRYKVLTGTKDVPYYKEKVCTTITPKNESKPYESCTREIDRYDKEDIYGWRNLDTKEGLPKGNITIGIFTDVYPEETSGGDNYTCQVTPNDGEEDGTTLNSSVAKIKWGIAFNVTDSYSGISLNNVLISCNSTDFNQLGDTTNPYGPYGFSLGNYECIFSKPSGTFHYNKTIIFVADIDKIVPVGLSESGFLSEEEHTWLEWLYNCWSSGSCKQLLENINKTSVNIWQRLTGTNRNVITQEDVLSYALSSSQNISINYTINVPYKGGVPVNELLPIRLYFWFTDTNRTLCYSQDKATDTNRAEAPYCLPLVAETLGPNNGSVNFKVDLRPALTAGTYNITRSIEIDPVGVWTQYGREDIGGIEVSEDNNKVNINLIEKTKSFFKNSGITGAVTNKILSKDNLIVLVVLLNTFILIYFIVSTKIKKK